MVIIKYELSVSVRGAVRPMLISKVKVELERWQFYLFSFHSKAFQGQASEKRRRENSTNKARQREREREETPFTIQAGRRSECNEKGTQQSLLPFAGKWFKPPALWEKRWEDTDHNQKGGVEVRDKERQE